MYRILSKLVCLGLVAAMLLALPVAGMGEQTIVITNVPAGVSTAWGEALPITVTVSDENGDVLEGALEVSIADGQSLRLGGNVELAYEYGATNMPANILYHALLGMNDGAVLRVQGDSLRDEVMRPGTYTVTYAQGEDELVCTVLVRGAISATIAILDHEIPLSDGKTVAEATPEPEMEPEDDEEIPFEEPIPVVVVLD